MLHNIFDIQCFTALSRFGNVLFKYEIILSEYEVVNLSVCELRNVSFVRIGHILRCVGLIFGVDESACLNGPARNLLLDVCNVLLNSCVVRSC